ncbi:MAG: hypothetical protein ACP5T2_05635 [Thermoprotei archaeon]
MKRSDDKENLNALVKVINYVHGLYNNFLGKGWHIPESVLKG